VICYNICTIARRLVLECYGTLFAFFLFHKVVFLKPRLVHFHEWAKSRPALEKTHCSSPEMYSSYRSWWITVLVLLTHVFGEALIETSKIHDLFIHYPKNTYLVCWDPLENGDKTHKKIVSLIIVNSVNS
jgi:hypothetical protein